ncbi:MAG: HAMP domain-containing protein [Cyclobacteriaceae bacterium]
MTESKIEQSKIWLITIFFLQLTVAIVLALAYSNALTNVIKEIRTTMSQLASGNFPPPLEVHTQEEIGQTKIAINHFLDRMKSASSYAEKLGNGMLNAAYDQRFESDVLAKALIHMQQKLNEAEKIQTKINWHNEGTARFNELLKNDTGNIRKLGDDILKMLVQHIQANQAALYIVNEEEKCFERISTYAYDKKRFPRK